MNCFKKDVEKKKYNGSNLIRKVTDEITYFIIHVMLDNPGIMLYEIQNEILTTFNMRIAESTICQTLHKSGKRCEQDEMLRALFVSEQG